MAEHQKLYQYQVDKEEAGCYRAIVKQIRNHFTGRHMTASQLERSLIAPLAAIGIEVQQNVGGNVTKTHCIWRVNALDFDGSAGTFNLVLTDLILSYREGVT